jgi:hypothetical protein
VDAGGNYACGLLPPVACLPVISSNLTKLRAAGYDDIGRARLTGTESCKSKSILYKHVGVCYVQLRQTPADAGLVVIQ